MAGQKHKGMLKGIRPEKCKPFKKGDERTKAAAKKGAEAVRAKWQRIKTLREAAEALRDLPARDMNGAFLGYSEGVAATLAMYAAAKNGDAHAFKTLAELLGEMENHITIKELPHLIDDIH